MSEFIEIGWNPKKRNSVSVYNHEDRKCSTYYFENYEIQDTSNRQDEECVGVWKIKGHQYGKRL